MTAIAVFYVYSPRQDELVWTMGQIGIDQFLFAYDFPIFDVKPTREIMDGYGFSEEELHKLYYANAVKVFGLK